jgi:hypothetical protein
MHEHVTLMYPGARDATGPRISSGFPLDLIGESAERLRILALLYAFVFFVAGILPAILLADVRPKFFGNVLLWGPGFVGITMALVVAAGIRSPRVPLASAMNLGLAFEIASSYAIAAAEFADPAELEMHRGMLGLSWVAVWVVLFTIVVPTSPRRVVLTALASVSSVPTIIALVMASGLTTVRIEPLHFFLGLVLPYLLVVVMAYVGARVVYRLGSEVKRARELGSYRLEEKLGEGGMGEVWRARHRMLARPAAIKLIRQSIASAARGGVADAVRQFEREAQAIARLRSPHTVDLFDYGVADDGTFFCAMELLDGLDADSAIRRFGPVPPERAIFLLRQVCHSLSEAHSCGLVHRDVKPANIFLCRYGEEFDFVKVLDFGIVRAARDTAVTAPMQTIENAVHGTPGFMAPEQTLLADVDTRADIYAVGCVAYWLLTGKPVFTAETAMGLLMQHAQAQPSAPSTRTDQPIPVALDELVLACLAKKPEDRPQAARELAHRLACIEGAEAWTQDRARDWWAAVAPARLE